MMIFCVCHMLYVQSTYACGACDVWCVYYGEVYTFSHYCGVRGARYVWEYSDSGLCILTYCFYGFLIIKIRRCACVCVAYV